MPARPVLVRTDGGRVAYFCTDPEAAAADVLGRVADRAAIEQVFHDVKEIWGAGQQQLRNVHANVGAYHLHLWAHTLVELWAWDRPEEGLVDRSGSPWDAGWRRPSHADRRKALPREMLRAEIQAAASGPEQTANDRAHLRPPLWAAVRCSDWFIALPAGRAHRAERCGS